MAKLSDPERRLLREVQRDAARPVAELARTVGMGASTIWRKLADLRAGGVIRARVDLVDPARVGLGLCVFAHVSLTDHSEASVTAFAAIVRGAPEILEAHALSGADDYLLKIRCRDVAAYEAFLSRNLLRAPAVRSVTSAFSLRELKDTTELPL